MIQMKWGNRSMRFSFSVGTDAIVIFHGWEILRPHRKVVGGAS